MGLPTWDCTVKALLPAVGVSFVDLIPGVDVLAEFDTLAVIRFPVS